MTISLHKLSESHHSRFYSLDIYQFYQKQSPGLMELFVHTGQGFCYFASILYFSFGDRACDPHLYIPESITWNAKSVSHQMGISSSAGDPDDVSLHTGG